MSVTNTTPAIVKYSDDPVLRKRVMSPYKDHCQYMKNATLRAEGSFSDGEYLTGDAQFQIPESCYIDDTGHFNSVEFNICYNQLMYYTIAKAVKEQAAGMFSHWDMDMYWRRQLPDVLITEFRSNFKRPLESKKFYGEIEFLSSRSIRNFQYINTLIRFTDDGKGYCEGSVKLAIINS
jgi:hypothetical protein